MTRRMRVGVVVLAAAIAAGTGLAAQQGVRPGAQQGRRPDVWAKHIRGPLYLIVEAGANITASVGRDGVLVVNTGLAEKSEQVLTTIQQLQAKLATSGLEPYTFAAETRSNMQPLITTPAPPKPIRYIVNTSASPEHLGGNERIGGAGRTITGGNVAGNIADASQGAAIIAHENVLRRLTTLRADGEAPAPFRALPTESFFGDNMKLSQFFNGEGVQIIHLPRANTDGDTIVFFRGTDVIHTGDVFLSTTYPPIDISKGGAIQGVIDGLNRIIDMAFAEFRHEGGTLMVPGHGRLADTADVAYYRDMLTVIRDRVQDHIAKGRTLEQVKAARPSRDYDPRYGSTSGPWTTDRFVDAVYRSLQK